MNLFDAYNQAIAEDDDPMERDEFCNSFELKTLVVDEIIEAMKEIRDTKSKGGTPTDTLRPMFSCVAFWFIIGIRVGKILRDAELVSK